jgi:hypothetical protein
MISLAETVAESGATSLRAPLPGEPCQIEFDYARRTFVWKSKATGESLRLPPIVEVILNMRGLTQEI